MNLYSKIIHWLARDIIVDLQAEHRKKLRAQRKEIMWEMQMPPRILKEGGPWPRMCLFVGGGADGRRISCKGEPQITVPIIPKMKAEIMRDGEIPVTTMTMEQDNYVREAIECEDSDSRTVSRIVYYRFQGLSRFAAMEQIFGQYPFPSSRR